MPNTVLIGKPGAETWVEFPDEATPEEIDAALGAESEERDPLLVSEEGVDRIDTTLVADEEGRVRQKNPLFDPEAERNLFIPYLDEKGDLVAPQLMVDVVKALMAPGQALEGQYQTPEEALNFALTFMGGGVASGGAPGKSLGTIGGPSAKTFAQREPVFLQAEKEGAPPDWILRKTGLFRDPDGIIKMQIDDKNMSVHSLDKLSTTPQKASTFIDHPTLRREYPELMDTLSIRKAAPGELGSREAGNFNLETGVITVREGLSKADIATTFIHELQHSAQKYEAFTHGINPDNVYRKAAEGLMIVGKPVSVRTFVSSDKLPRLRLISGRLDGIVEGKHVQPTKNSAMLDLVDSILENPDLPLGKHLERAGRTSGDRGIGVDWYDGIAMLDDALLEAPLPQSEVAHLRREARYFAEYAVRREAVDDEDFLLELYFANKGELEARASEGVYQGTYENILEGLQKETGNLSKRSGGVSSKEAGGELFEEVAQRRWPSLFQ